MRRLLTVSLTALALVAPLAACGSDSDDAASGTSPTADVTAEPEVTAEPDEAGATEPAPAATATTGTDVAGSVTVESAYGPIDIPAEPQRIVGDLMALDYMTALGIDAERFVGVFDADFFPDDHYMADDLGREELVDPGFQWEPNLEVLAAADPDLIVLPFDQIDGAPQLNEMEEIAPVLVVPTSDTRDPRVRYGGTASFQDWRSTLRSFAEVFDRQDEAEAYIAETEAEIAALQADYGDVIADTTATEMKSTPDFVAINALSSALESGVLGTILLSELGFTAPPQQAAATVDEFGSIDISQENLDLVDGDLLFVEVREDTKTYEESPLWDTLSVVQNGGVAEVGNHWEYGGAQAARVVIADIRAALEGLATRS
jgi:iron complex transport system substrate-binding protein